MVEFLKMRGEPAFLDTLLTFSDRVLEVGRIAGFSNLQISPIGEENLLDNLGEQLVTDLTRRARGENKNSIVRVEPIVEDGERVARHLSIGEGLIDDNYKGSVKSVLVFGMFKIHTPTPREIIIYGGPVWDGFRVFPAEHAGYCPISRKTATGMSQFSRGIYTLLQEQGNKHEDSRNYKIPVQVPKGVTV